MVRVRTIYRETQGRLEEIGTHEEGAWINLVNPTPAEIEETVSWFQIPPDFLTDPLDVDERARVEREGGSILIVLRTPHRDPPGADIPYTTLPLGIILTHNVTIT
ncbi:MAG: CorA family divalent cation transporter, partial [Methanolinea sp.]